MEYPLTKDQQRIFDLVEATTTNVFIGGKPGVGKTVLIRALQELGRKSYVTGAPTGLAALNGGGKTIHSLFGIPTSDGIIDPTYNRFSSSTNVWNNARYNIKNLIIDEISMVRCDQLDFIDRFLRKVKERDLPFGGIQVIAVGDFFQLPPVTKGTDKKALVDVGYESPFAFSARVWSSFENVELTEVLRQKGDPNFVKILHEARSGEPSGKTLVAINDRVETFDDVRIKLTGTNAQADAINQRELDRINEPEIEFHANSFGDWPKFPCETILKLKIGAQVMVKLNAADRPPNHSGKWESTIVNGTLGIVKSIHKPDPNDPNAGKDAFVVVATEKHGDVKIWRKRWERKEKVRVGNDWDERVIASFEQVPLSLAWAISMHKSQGQSFDKVHIDASKIFAEGQLYVALSRCRTLRGITLEDRINRTAFRTNPHVLRFMETINA